MSGSHLPTPEDGRNHSHTYEKPDFKSEVFYERATNWGATPLLHIPEQMVVCDMLVQRFDYMNQDSDPLLANYMRTIYYGRFHVRQERNYSAYVSRLNQTPYEDLPGELRYRTEQTMVGLADIKDILFVQEENQMASIELARKTHPNEDITYERETIEGDILEACVELDPDAYVPDEPARIKVRGSDVITIPHLDTDSDPANRQNRYLFVTKKSTLAMMPRTDTQIVRRENYILDLKEFARYEPKVAQYLMESSVYGQSSEEWCRNVTKLWRDIEEVAPLITDVTRSAFKDVSTTYYTVNQRRLELIQARSNTLTSTRHEESDELKALRAEAKAKAAQLNER